MPGSELGLGGHEGTHAAFAGQSAAGRQCGDHDIGVGEDRGQVCGVLDITCPVLDSRGLLCGDGAAERGDLVAAAGGFGDDLASGISGPSEDVDSGHDGLLSGCGAVSAAFSVNPMIQTL